ncbi:DUF3103 family protein [Rubrivirga sp. IMCC45206]|uniref:DUF3103 family protein n=1 Tax=Rubrivirga sp. IMCC45206 TaxID=3391614 RepID=UPI0039902CFB
MFRGLPAFHAWPLAAALVLGLAACDTAGPALPGAPAPTTASLSAADRATNDALVGLAQMLAAGLNDLALRQAVVKGAEARFNGAPEILYRDLAKADVGGTTFESAMLASFANTNSLVEGTSLLNEARKTGPTLTVGVPVHLDSWNVRRRAPIVAYMPAGVDDVDLEYVPAYRPDGHRIRLSAKEPPRYPVVVVSFNERTDAEGTPLQGYIAPEGLEPPPCEVGEELNQFCGGGGGGGGGGTPTTRTSPHTEVLEWVNVLDDREPWIKEPAEIRVQVIGASNPTAFVYNGTIGDPEPEHQRHTLNRFLFNWYPENSGFFNGVRWYEEDSGATIGFNVSLTGQVGTNPQARATVGFTFSWKDGSDEMGSAPANFADPLSTAYNTGWIEWSFK